MKKSYRYIVMVLMVVVLLSPLLGEGATSNQVAVATNIAATPGEIAGREEVIYANLKANGDVKEVYVVNILDIPQAGMVTDYGSYATVKNLTNTEALTKTNNQVTVKAPAGLFYYQGKMADNELPWRVNIAYFLDGKEMSPSEVAGKKGHLEVKLNTSQNPRIDSTFFENYLLQVSMTLDASISDNIIAKGGMIANAGKNKLITYTIMPGKSGEISLSGNVIDFTMPGIELSAVPFSMGIDLPDTSEMTGNMMTLSEAIIALNDGVSKLEKGSQEMKKGTAALEAGSSYFNMGLGSLSVSSKDLIDGSKQIKEALKVIADSLQGTSGDFEFSALAQLPEGLLQLAAGLDEISTGLTGLKQSFSMAYTSLNAAILEIPDDSITQQELTALYMANPDKKALIDQLVEFYAAGQKIKGTYQAVNPAFAAVEVTLENVITSNQTITGSLLNISKQVQGAMEGSNDLDQIGQLSSSLSMLSANYDDLHKGFVAYTGGISELEGSYASIHRGISEIAGGTSGLHGGLSDLYAGTTELNNAVKDMPTQIESEIDKMISQYDKSDFKPISFVSPQNEVTVAVQFVIRTEAIEKAKEPEENNFKTEKSTIWTRFLDLFR